MRKRFVPIVAVVFAATVFPAGRSAPEGQSSGLIVHEWGTFTSIAGIDGKAMEWMPQSGPIDLPSFVERLAGVKANCPGKVRMETPVLYFYAPTETTVNVGVRIQKGILTEWYPRADMNLTSLLWRNVKIRPGAAPAFPVENAKNHYYHARNTDASPLQVAGQQEKFLFYRGIGQFEPPLSATVGADGNVNVKNLDGGAVGDVMLFENRGGVTAHQTRRGADSTISLDPVASGGETASPQSDLQHLLMAHGLYPKEAKAMVETWDDSWFEHGSRLFYVYSDRRIDAILPLDIKPAPAQVVRVFVGRIELVTAATRREITTALAKNDRATLAKYGRFLEPMLKAIS